MKIIHIASLLTLLLLSSCPITQAEEPEDQQIQPPSAPAESMYAYDEDDIPEVFFFPKEKARWDGSMVTMREWYMLTDRQKERFITEYLWQLQDEYKKYIEVMSSDYLKALNIFSYYSDDSTLREPSTKFIDILLNGQGKITDKERQKTYNPPKATY